MEIPKTIQDIERLIDLEIPESIWLDYKASPALSKKKKDEICKDVSAFANSDGGVLIYGVKEEYTVPKEIDDGVDTSKISKEWIDEILATNITPIISGIEIIEIKKTANNSVFVVNIQKSFRGPHQSPDKKYYKRSNARSAPMEHYEIEDIRNRRQVVPYFISIDVQVQDPWVQLVVENTGSEPARDVKFIFSETFSWYKNSGNGELPNALKNGIKFFPPKRKMVFNFGGFRDILSSEDDDCYTYFNVSVNYIHPQTESEVSEDFYIDLKDFLHANFTENYLKDISRNLKELKNLVSELNKTNKSLQGLKSISGATGLDLSFSTLVNLSKILKNDDSFQSVNLEECPPDVIKEVLSVNQEMANQIYFHYRNQRESPLEELPGMTEKLIEKIKNCTKVG